MPLYVTWQQIGIRLLLACVASFLLGINRDEHGRPAGMRTTMLVTLAATLAMIQVNLLLHTTGKSESNFNTLDLMRLPLGILDGIGFIGAGTILKKESTAIGVTTAATLWCATVLGLLFGGGQLVLGCAGTAIAVGILVLLKRLEVVIPRRRSGSLDLQFSGTPPTEESVRGLITAARCKVETWKAEYGAERHLQRIQTGISWLVAESQEVKSPEALEELRSLPGLTAFTWERNDS